MFACTKKQSLRLPLFEKEVGGKIFIHEGGIFSQLHDRGRFGAKLFLGSSCLPPPKAGIRLFFSTGDVIRGREINSGGGLFLKHPLLAGGRVERRIVGGQLSL